MKSGLQFKNSIELHSEITGHNENNRCLNVNKIYDYYQGYKYNLGIYFLRFPFIIVEKVTKEGIIVICSLPKG